MKFKWGGDSIFPRSEVSGQGLLDLHGDSIWLVSTVGSAFLKSEILWVDFEHEFRFKPPTKRGDVCQQALRNAAAALSSAIKDVPGRPAHT